MAEQVLQSQPNLIISYKIADLLGRETSLCNTLWLLKDAAQQTFFDILKTRGEKLLRYPLWCLLIYLLIQQSEECHCFLR
ncbi:hypothetical protein H6P81_002878 [Aristolochia fimbriata]|uniref:Conserved Oligomeric Golgi complex subunit 6 C-terminal domain-containing protein n=1 Tax=Aristolochia fimbriata TaxID=158543 RepID=A0AAV7FAZ7_ARIFI|nr:hypothetical protein H6P81_002878 [Aristolochia fimbriata]